MQYFILLVVATAAVFVYFQFTMWRKPGDPKRPLKESELIQLINEISQENEDRDREIGEDMAIDSEYGGDSDADDDLPVTFPSRQVVPPSLRTRSSASSPTPTTRNQWV